MSARRIAFSGSAGTGKSTLARAVAEHLGVPYIEEGFRRRVDEGLLMYKLDDAQRRELMREMWAEQRAREVGATDGFVSDRSSVDFAAFWLHYGLEDSEEETERFLADMRRDASGVDRVVLCPWGVLPLESDGVRSTNRWLQLRYQALVEGMHARMTERDKLLRVPDTDDLDARVAFVLERL
jgi:predicted ATPase